MAEPAPRPVDRVRYIVGVDGGGSRTRARVTELSGPLVGEGEAGPSSLSQGIPQAWRHVDQAVSEAFFIARVPRPALERIALGLGLAGARAPELREQMLAANPGYALVSICRDGEAAHHAAFDGGPGVMLVAGTGSVAEAIDAERRERLVGGWGWPSGDEGSGAWIGRQALAQAQQALDGRGPAGALARAVWAATAPDEDGLRRWSRQGGARECAGLAPLVFDSADQDPAAAALLQRAVDALTRHVDAADPSGLLPLAVLGSVGQRLQPRLPERLRQRCITPAGDAMDGALLLARWAHAAART